MPLDNILSRKDQRKKLRLDSDFPVYLFVCLFVFSLLPASHNRGSSCHRCCRCLKEGVEVAVLVSWGPEEAAGMALTSPPPTPPLLSTTLI